MHKRINITLPENTLKLLNRAAGKRGRSRLIDAAIRGYVGQRSKARLRKELAEGYRRNATRNLEIAAEWFPLDEEAWEKSQR